MKLLALLASLSTLSHPSAGTFFGIDLLGLFLPQAPTKRQSSSHRLDTPKQGFDRAWKAPPKQTPWIPVNKSSRDMPEAIVGPRRTQMASDAPTSQAPRPQAPRPQTPRQQVTRPQTPRPPAARPPAPRPPPPREAAPGAAGILSRIRPDALDDPVCAAAAAAYIEAKRRNRSDELAYVAAAAAYVAKLFENPSYEPDGACARVAEDFMDNF